MAAERRENWKCSVCKEKEKTQQDINVTPTSEKAGRKTKEDEDERKKEGNVLKQQNDEVSVNNSLMIEMNRKLGLALSEISELTKSVKYMSDKYDELFDEVKILRVVKEKYDVLNVQLSELENRMNEFDQYSRNKNLEIKGVEEMPNENLRVTIAKLANKIGAASVSEKDIDVVHRINNRNNREPRDIIVQFKDRESRDKIMERRREKVTSNEVTNGKTEKVIYVNDHLTAYNKKLLWETKSRCREIHFKFIWTKDGKIFVRKDENERAYRIRSEDDIKTLV